MSDTYFVTVNCPYCGEENPKNRALEDGGVLGLPYKEGRENIFTCDYCGKKFKIVQGAFRAEKVDVN